MRLCYCLPPRLACTPSASPSLMVFDIFVPACIHVSTLPGNRIAVKPPRAARCEGRIYMTAEEMDAAVAGLVAGVLTDDGGAGDADAGLRIGRAAATLAAVEDSANASSRA